MTRPLPPLSAPGATWEPTANLDGSTPVDTTGIRESLLPMFFGRFGGQEVPDFLLPALQELEAAYVEAMGDEAFLAEFEQLRRDYLGRPSALFECRNISTEHVKIILKREDLVHGGAHKGNNVLGQGLLAKRMGKKRLIAETGAGQHGTATAMVAALLGLDCTIYMGAHDVARQKPNVERMELMGATVVSVTQGNSSLKDAIDVALEEWAVHLDDTFYLLGTAAGPHPWPTMVRDFHSVISQESKEQMLERYGRLPDEVIAAVGGGSNAIGAFANYIDEAEVELVGVEPGGEGLETGKHGAPICAGKVGVLHGMRSYVMLDETGEVTASHSVSAGLDYPSVGPEHSALHDSGRAVYVPINDDEAVRAFRELSRREGIIPAMESSHGLAQAFKAAAAYEQAVAEGAESVVLVDGGREIAVRGTDEPLLLLVNLSGRGDKDMEQVADRLAALN